MVTYYFEIAKNNGAFSRCYPNYSDSLTVEYEKERNCEFFRKKLNGKLVFQGPDFDLIEQAEFDTEFRVNVYIKTSFSGPYNIYFQGNFYKTDCEFNLDSKTVTTSLRTLDNYSQVLAGIEKEYDLIKLNPEQAIVDVRKRPIVQVYCAGEERISCFLSGMWWEQDCEAVNENEYYEEAGILYKKLNYTYKFQTYKRQRILTFEPARDSYSPELPEFAIDPDEPDNDNYNVYDFTQGGWHFYSEVDGANFKIYIERDGVVYWLGEGYLPDPNQTTWKKFAAAQSGSPAQGNIYITQSIKGIYMRVLTDVEMNGTYPIPPDDLVSDHRNYHFVGPYDPHNANVIIYSKNEGVFPTEWGLASNDMYYAPPDQQNLYYPVARSLWADFSMWMKPVALDWIAETNLTKVVEVRSGNYHLYSAIAMLLNQIDSRVQFRPNSDYSEFLFGDGSELGVFGYRLLIAPKSNIKTLEYDMPAQQAKITLKKIFDMLRDCYRLYWFIDEDRHLHIEHIRYFMNGGSYTQVADVGVDLTRLLGRPGIRYAAAQNTYSFDRPSMPERYEFRWMDDETEPFNGYPINIISKFVEPGNIEEITLQDFSSDVDYIIVNPANVSSDGFVLMCAKTPASADAHYTLPFYEYTVKNYTMTLQNGLASFAYLQKWYDWDMPAPYYEINGVQKQAQKTKKYKTQSVQFPAITDPNMLELIKTNIGNGQIEKLSVNLSSRNATATLKYDTQ